MGLLSGLESTAKKRRRLCSDQSGVDILGSKLSGYESDSSFSDLSSIHGTESNDVKELDLTKNLPSASSDTAHNGPTDNLGLIDTNSNLCKNFDLNKSTLKSEPMDCKEDIILPDKAALLDIMKQAFNDGSFKKTAKSNPKCATMTTTKFYGKPSVKSRGATANKTEKVETVVSESPCVSPLENTPVVPMESQESKCSPESSNKEVQDPAQVIFNQLEKNKQPEEILRLSDDVLNRLQEVMNQQEDALNQSDTVLKQSETLNQTNETLVQPETPDQPVDVSNQQVDVLDESVGVSDEPVDVQIKQQMCQFNQWMCQIKQ
ncbi:hypothetical protein JTB14_011771 [Gonioctena quinquepunctata]|nr:hypothetical protein JTB14_011771 [Gonioctena quinquepunctata]